MHRRFPSACHPQGDCRGAGNGGSSKAYRAAAAAAALRGARGDEQCRKRHVARRWQRSGSSRVRGKRRARRPGAAGRVQDQGSTTGASADDIASHDGGPRGSSDAPAAAGTSSYAASWRRAWSTDAHAARLQTDCWRAPDAATTPTICPPGACARRASGASGARRAPVPFCRRPRVSAATIPRSDLSSTPLRFASSLCFLSPMRFALTCLRDALDVAVAGRAVPGQPGVRPGAVAPQGGSAPPQTGGFRPHPAGTSQAYAVPQQPQQPYAVPLQQQHRPGLVPAATGTAMPQQTQQPAMQQQPPPGSVAKPAGVPPQGARPPGQGPHTQQPQPTYQQPPQQKPS